MALVALHRNRYFYGKLMDVEQFNKEQKYFLERQALLNRLALGSGVLCGLNVLPDPAGVVIQAGVALDHAGRMIIVPEPVVVNPAQLTDDSGQPDGDPLPDGTVLLSLSYHETCTDPVPSFINDCDTPGDCAASTTREGFRILVRKAADPPPAPPSCPFPNWGQSSPDQVQKLLGEAIGAVSAEPPADTSIPLARITLPGTIDAWNDRPLVVGNALFRQLLQCVQDSTSGVRVLRYVSGDGQGAVSGSALPQPVIVEVLSGPSQPVGGVSVQFVASAGGSANPATVNTDANGRAQTTWILGNSAGQQELVASAAGSAYMVTFRATAQ